jgi:hypothetical protein
MIVASQEGDWGCMRGCKVPHWVLVRSELSMNAVKSGRYNWMYSNLGTNLLERQLSIPASCREILHSCRQGYSLCYNTVTVNFSCVTRLVECVTQKPVALLATLGVDAAHMCRLTDSWYGIFIGISFLLLNRSVLVLY